MTRTCCRCKQIKPLESFVRNKNKPQGRDYQCRSCRMIMDRQSRRLSEEEVLERRFEKRLVKAVSQFTLSGEFVATYDNLTLASRATGIDRSNIYRAVMGKYTRAGQYLWAFASRMTDEETRICQHCGKVSDADTMVWVAVDCMRRYKNNVQSKHSLY